EPSADQRSVPLAAPVEHAHVSVLDSLHGVGQAADRATEEKMEVSDQNTEGVHLDQPGTDRTGQTGKEVPDVQGTLKEGPLRDAALKNVVP
ncbi:MAG: hypothetical protein ACYTF8_09795, partial [Planctomycetota bacterium]